MKPVRALVASVPNAAKSQEFRLAFDRLENLVFEELREGAEKDAMKHFVATYDEVAAIVNAAKASKGD